MVAQAVILAGGRGTRLGALTRHTPKPMLPVGGRPFLEHLVWNLSRHGIREILLSCGHLGDQIVDHFKGWDGGRTRVRCFVEPEPLGTGGALRFLADALEGPFFFLNGDSLFDINFLDLPLLPAASAPASAIMALRHVPNASRYGRVETAVPCDTTKPATAVRVDRFLEKESQARPGLINAGICWMDPELLARLPEGASSVERDLFPHLAVEGKLFGKAYDAYFMDMGVPEDYQRADGDLATWRRRPALFFDRDGVLNVNHGYVHTPERFEWVAGAPQAIRWCNEHGYLVIIVTNQSGMARGFYDEAQFEALMAWMQSDLGAMGAHMDAWYHCPHHPTEGVGDLCVACQCRKPNPGMLEQALSAWEIDKARALLIGDNPSDVEAARRVGITGHLFAGDVPLDLFLRRLL